MLDLNLHFHASCPKHPLYRPSDGQGAIKGGCIYCQALYKIGLVEAPLLAAIREAEELLDRYRVKHMPRSRRKVRQVVQPDLFEMGARR